MIDRALFILKSEEGFRPYVYDDATGDAIVPGYTVKGHPTLWFGLCVEKGRTPALPASIPDEALETIVERKWLELVSRAPWVEAQPEDIQVALTCIAYQIGVEGLLGFKLALEALQRDDRETAAENFLNSKWFRQTPARAGRMARMIRGHD